MIHIKFSVKIRVFALVLGDDCMMIYIEEGDTKEKKLEKGRKKGRSANH